VPRCTLSAEHRDVRSYTVSPPRGYEIREYLLDLDISIVKKAQAPVYMLKRTRDDQRQTDTDDFRDILEEKIDDAHLEGAGGVVEFSELSTSTSWKGFNERGLTLVYFQDVFLRQLP
jgi:hypothetical protein